MSFVGHTGTVWSIGLAQRDLLVSGSFDGTVRLWHQETAEARVVLEGRESVIATPTLSGDGRVIAAGSYDGRILLVDARSSDTPVMLGRESHTVRWVNLSEDGRKLVSTSRDGILQVWEVPLSGHERAELRTERRGHSRPIWCAALSADGDWSAVTDSSSSGISAPARASSRCARTWAAFLECR
jgi:WD40 repeat protein